jgi:hypothetical protein
VPAVVAWARGPMAKLFGDSLTDPRVGIRETDVGDLIRAARSEQEEFQALVVHPFGQRPSQSRKAGAPQITMHHAITDPDHARDDTLGQALVP